MWMWCTAAVYLVGSLAFISLWVQGKKLSLIVLAVSLAASCLAALIPALSPSQRFMVALAMGGLGWSISSIICSRECLLRAACVLVAAILPWMPIALCSTIIWEYCLVAAGMLLCLLMAVGDKLYHRAGTLAAEQYAVLQKNDPLLVCLPLLIIPVVCLLLVGQAELSFAVAAMQTVILFGISALLLCLQEQISQRKRAQKLNDAFGRWQRESRDYMNIIRSQRHDFNLHLHAISGLLSSGEYEECGQYVKKLVAEAAAVNDIMPVADAVVGSMLYNMREQARRRGSDITYHITYDMADVVCNGFECNKIIGNLLQNAIDAMQSAEDLACGIQASIFKRRGYTAITVENRFTGNKDSIASAFEPGYSTKQEHDGIGLSMVLQTVEQYAGRVYPEFEDERVRFVVNIPNRVTLHTEEEVL